MTVYKPVPANIINSFNQLVFHGKLQELKVLVERNSDLDWTALGKGRRKGLTAIHHALNGRFRSLSSHTGALIGGHEVNQNVGIFICSGLHTKTPCTHLIVCVCVCCKWKCMDVKRDGHFSCLHSRLLLGYHIISSEKSPLGSWCRLSSVPCTASSQPTSS